MCNKFGPIAFQLQQCLKSHSVLGWVWEHLGMQRVLLMRRFDAANFDTNFQMPDSCNRCFASRKQS